MKEILKYKSYILNFVCAFFTYLSFLVYFRVFLKFDSFNFIFTCSFFMLYLFYNKENSIFASYENRDKFIVNIYSIFLSIILIIGSIVYPYAETGVDRIFNVINILSSVVGIIGFTLLFRILIMKIVKYEFNINNLKNKNIFSKRKFLIYMIILVLCWLPYFLRFYPGIMTRDSYYSIHFVEKTILSDHHTFGHTWFFGMFYLIGKAIFTNLNAAVAFYMIIQMFICSFIFVKIIKFLYEKGVNKIIIIIATLFIYFSPLYAIYSITLWRDILFGMSFVLLFISLCEFIENGYKFTKSALINYIFAILFILFFRNNGIYIFIFFIPFLISFSKKNKMKLAISHILVIIAYFVIKGPIFDYFNVQKSVTSEAYSVPLQQIARVLASDYNVSEKDYDYLNSLFDVEKVKTNYTPYISDPVKGLVDSKKLSNTKTHFFKVWFKLLIKYPSVYIESYLCQTLGYWYPDVIYWATGEESKNIFDEDVYSDPIMKNYLGVLDHTTSRRIPLSNLFWSLGLMFLIFSFSIMVLIYKKQYRYLLCYSPVFCLWISLMLSSPVFCELRYIYGLFASIILIMIFPFLNKHKFDDKEFRKNKKKKSKLKK